MLTQDTKTKFNAAVIHQDGKFLSKRDEDGNRTWNETIDAQTALLDASDEDSIQQLIEANGGELQSVNVELSPLEA